MNLIVVKNWFQALVGASLIASATLARADAPGPVEIAVATGYVHGVGSVSARMPELQHLAGAGGALRLDVGWRVDPRWMVGAYYEGARYGSGHAGTDGMTGHAAGLQAQFHLSPWATFDPWIGAGLGWRGLWLDHGQGTHAMQGVDLARLQVGLDYRVSDRFSLAPVLGVSITEMLQEKPPGASAYTDVADRKVSSFLFAGLNGRFDVLGGSSTRP